MLNDLQSQFKKEFQLGHVAAILNHVGNIISICQANYLKDGDAKNAAIDSICAILQSHKDQPAATSTTPQG